MGLDFAALNWMGWLGVIIRVGFAILCIFRPKLVFYFDTRQPHFRYFDKFGGTEALRGGFMVVRTIVLILFIWFLSKYMMQYGVQNYF